MAIMKQELYRKRNQKGVSLSEVRQLRGYMKKRLKKNH